MDPFHGRRFHFFFYPFWLMVAEFPSSSSGKPVKQQFQHQEHWNSSSTAGNALCLAPIPITPLLLERGRTDLFYLVARIWLAGNVQAFELELAPFWVIIYENHPLRFRFSSASTNAARFDGNAARMAPNGSRSQREGRGGDFPLSRFHEGKGFTSK